MASVFLSYSRRDQPFVRRLYDALAADRRETWVDWEGIPPSAEWLQEVYTAIDGADTFVFVLSPDSLASSVCASETAYARQSRKRIIPLLCRDISPADVRAVEPLAPLADLNWIPFRDTDDFNQAFARLRFALDTDLDYWHLSSDLLLRAKKWEVGARNANLTLRGSELVTAERWVTQGADKEPRPTALQLEYITASRKDATTRQRRLLAGVSGALVVTLVLAVISSLLFQQTQAQNTQLVAKNAQLLAKALAGASTQALANNQVDEALLLAAEGMRRQPDASETRNALFGALEYSPYLDAVLNGATTRDDTGRSVAFDKTGRLLMSATQSGRVTIWDTSTGAQLHEFMAAYQGCASYYDAALSPDGQTVATLARATCAQAGVDIWNARTGAHVVHLQPVSALSRIAPIGLLFTPDGNKLAVVENGSVGVWDVASGRRIQQVPMRPNVAWSWIAISPDGSILAAGDYPFGDDILWNLQTGSPIRTFTLAAGAAFGATFSPDGKTLALATNGTRIQFIDVASGEVSSTEIAQNVSGITSLAYTRDGSRLIFNDENTNSLHMWDLRNNVAIEPPLLGHTDVVVRATVSPDGRHFATIGNDTKVILWRSAPSSARSLPYGPSLDGQSPIAFSADGKHAVTCATTPQPSIEFWDTTSAAVTGTLSTDFECGIGQQVSNSLAWSPDGSKLAVSTGNRIQVWSIGSAPTDAHLQATLSAPQSQIKSVVFSPNSRLVAASSLSGAVNSPEGSAAIWDVATYTQLQTFDRVSDVAFSPDSQTLALAAEGDKQGEVQLWNVASRTLASPITDAAQGVEAVAFSRDGATVASIDNTGVVNFWDVRTRKADVRRSFVGASSRFTQLYGITYSPDGKTLAAYDNLTITLWDVQANRQLVRPIFDPRGFNNIQFSADGQYLAEAQVGGPVILRFVTPSGWAAEACRIADRNLTQAEWRQFVGDAAYQRTCPNLPTGT
jgi:WD40 repeat protein